MWAPASSGLLPAQCKRPNIHAFMCNGYVRIDSICRKIRTNVNNIISNLLVSPNTNYTMFLLGHNNFELLTGDMHENVYVWWKFSLYFCLPLPLVFSSLLFFHPSSQASPSLLSLFSSFFSFRLCFFRRVRISRLHFSPLLLVSSWCGFSLC